METNHFQLSFKGYIWAVFVSLISLWSLLIASISILNIPFFVCLFFGVVATVLHFALVFGLYIIVFPLLTVFEEKSAALSLRTALDKYIPVFAISFAVLFGIMWMTDFLNSFVAFLAVDVLFTCYISLYYYLKNQQEINEQARN